MGRKIKRKDLKYRTNKYTYGFQQYDTRRSFGDNIYPAKITIDETEMGQANLLEHIMEFSARVRPKTAEGKNKKRINS